MVTRSFILCWGAQPPIVVAASRDGTHPAAAIHLQQPDVQREIGRFVKTVQFIAETTALLWKLREFSVTRMESKTIRSAHSEHKEYSGTSD